MDVLAFHSDGCLSLYTFQITIGEPRRGRVLSLSNLWEKKVYLNQLRNVVVPNCPNFKICMGNRFFEASVGVRMVIATRARLPASSNLKLVAAVHNKLIFISCYKQKECIHKSGRKMTDIQGNVGPVYGLA